MQNKIRTLIEKLNKDQAGLSTVEYVVLLVLIVAMSVGAWNLFGADVKDKLTKSKDEFKSKATFTSSGTN